MNFVFDIDGTICFDGKTISKEILVSLKEIQNLGHEVIFASARPIRDLMPVLEPCFHSNTLIGANGALVSQNKNITSYTSFNQKDISIIKKLLAEHEALYLIDGLWDYSYTATDKHDIYKRLDPSSLAQNVLIEAHKEIIKALILEAKNKEELTTKLSDLNVVLNEYKKEDLIDLSPKGVNKAYALKKIGISEYIAFGNDSNDVEMFKNASYSVMVGNHEDLKKYATIGVTSEREIVDTIKNLLIAV